MILLNNVSVGNCTPESTGGPPTSFFSKSLDYGEYVVEVRHIDTTEDSILLINAFLLVVLPETCSFDRS